MLDKSSIDSGVVRVGFIEPELDVVISCSNPTEVKVFIGTIDVLQHLTPLRTTTRMLRFRLSGNEFCPTLPNNKRCFNYRRDSRSVSRPTYCYGDCMTIPDN